MTRRELLLSTAAATVSVGRARVRATPGQGFRGPYCFFSKPLPDLGWAELGRTVKQAGFDGVDLTVRPNGHVLPERVATDLPRALDAIRASGVEVPMITTGLLSAADPAARPTFEAAGNGGVRFLKPGYYKYQLKDVHRELADAGRQLASLATLASQYGIVIGYHTHAGFVGGPTLDFLPEIEKLDRRTVGVYFDVRHAVVEGGRVGWKVAAAYAMPRIRMVAVKDCVWEKDAEGQWRESNRPLGQGMVDWPAFCRMLADASYHGPVSIHIEYDVEGASPAARRDRVLAAAREDLAFIKRHMHEAYRV